jgi:hypothetical protein
LAAANHSPIIALTETHLNPSVLNEEININNYNIYRSDRTSRKQGGVMMYIRDKLIVNHEKAYSNGVCEFLIIRLAQSNTVMITFYRPPDTNVEQFQDAIDELKRIDILSTTPSPSIILLGDFNFPSVRWPGPVIWNKRSKGDKKQFEILLEFTNAFFMTQAIDKPTRKDNYLDLIFTNSRDLLTQIEVFESIQTDHKLVECAIQSFCPKVEMHTSSNINRSKLDKLNFYNANFDKIRDEISNINWVETFKTLTLDEKLDFFMETIEYICSKHVTEKRRPKKTKFQRKRRALARKRTRITKQIEKTPTHQKHNKLRKKYINLEVELVDCIKAEREQNEKRAIEKIKVNSKYFFSYSKRYMHSKPTIGPFEINDKLVTKNNEICEALSEQYKSVFTIPKQDKLVSDPVSFFEKDIKDGISTISFTEKDIEEAIDELKPNSASGPDGLHSILLKECKKELATPIFLIWYDSFTSHKIPEKLKLGNVCPIYKGGSRAKPAQYRPVSLTSNLIKIFEKIIRKGLTKYLEQNEKLMEFQHGFRKFRSTLSQLLDHTEYIIDQVQEGNVDVIYLDFAKAFDKVDHGILLHKMRDLGIHGNIGIWLANFIQNRYQRIVANDEQSELVKITSGVPQGTVLGPLLFLIMINDINNTTQSCRLGSFADDTRITKSIKTTMDCIDMQGAVKNVSMWCDLNGMELNENKFEVIKYGKIEELLNYEYKTTKGEILKVQPNVKDLGVMLSNDFEYELHINNVIEKGNNLSNWVTRTFQDRSIIVMLTLYKSIIRPRIDYAIQLYYPYKITLISKIEAIQRHYTALIKGLENLNYFERLKYLRLFSLQRRAERYIIMYIWKIIERRVVNLTHKPIEITENERTGRKVLINKLITKTGRLQTIQYNSFSFRAGRLFNSLPQEIRDLKGTSVDCFKRKLDGYLKILPDEPPLLGMTRAHNNSIIIGGTTRSTLAVH